MTTEPALTCEDVRDLAPAYVLHALEPEDEAAVRSHLGSCRRPHPELADLGGAAAVLAEAVEPVEPPSALRARILDAARAEPRTGREATYGQPAHGEPPRPEGTRREGTRREALRATDRPVAPVVDLSARRRRWVDASPATWALRAAAVVAIVVLGAWNALLQGQVSALDRFRSTVAAVADAGAQPGALSATLMGDAQPSARGVAAVRTDGTILLAMAGLEPTQGSEVYEAWVVPAAGAPVPVGSFTVASDGTGVLTSGHGPVAAGSGIALTREPGPGATTPTMPIVSKGATQAG